MKRADQALTDLSLEDAKVIAGWPISQESVTAPGVTKRTAPSEDARKLDVRERPNGLAVEVPDCVTDADDLGERSPAFRFERFLIGGRPIVGDIQRPETRCR